MADDLEIELTTDPLGWGYNVPGVFNAGPGPMTDSQAAAELNVVRRTVEPASILSETFLRGMAKGEWDALAAVDREYLEILLARDSIDIRTGTEMRDALLAMFPVGTETRINLLVLATIQVSRGVELELGTVGEGDVWDVRHGNQ